MTFDIYVSVRAWHALADKWFVSGFEMDMAGGV